MGEARRKRHGAPNTVVDGPTTVRETAERLLTFVVEPLQWRGACYYSSFLLRYLLQKDHGIMSSVAVGWIYDPAQEAWASHAWHVFDGQPTDLALHYPLHVQVTPRGDITILGTTIRRGAHSYQRTVELPPGAVTVAMRGHPADRPRREAEHQKMVNLAQSGISGVEAYLRGAPSGLFDQAMAAFRSGA